MSGSGLAAVHLAAALDSTALQAPPAAPASKPTTVTELAAAFPDLCASLRTEGAALERARITGIEAHALPGHEKLIAEMKADCSVTPDMAAGRILAAEKTARGAQLQGIKDVESATGKMLAAPSSAPAAAPTVEKGTTPEAWKAEYEASSKLQSEFATADDYVALKKAEAGGKIRVLGGTRAS